MSDTAPASSAEPDAPTAADAAEAPVPASRPAEPTRRTAVLAGLVAATALFGTTRLTWVDALAANLTGTSQALTVSGADAAPAVVALAIVALAAALATSLSSSWVRFVTGPVLILTGIGAGIAALGPLRNPVAAAGGAVTESTGVSGGSIDAQATSWPWLALVPAVVLVLVGAAVVVRGGRWPRRSRYRSAAAAVVPGVDPREDPAAAWDALTRGEDPTEGSADEPADDAPATDPRDEPGR